MEIPLYLGHCVPACELSQLSPVLVDSLYSIQRLINEGLEITSGFRSVEWEHSRGRFGSSSHTKGLAVDVLAVSSSLRYRIVCAAMFLGIPRIGVGKSFVHLDIDKGKSCPCMWHYYD